MEFFFPFLMDSCDPDTCDGGMICWDEDEKKEARAAHLWRQDGLSSKSRGSFSKGIDKNDSYTTNYTYEDDTERTSRSSNLPRRYNDDATVTSYDPSRHQNDLVANGTGRTYPTTGTESHSEDSEDSAWSQSSRGTRTTTQSFATRNTTQSFATKKSNYGQHRRSAWVDDDFGVIEEAEIRNVWSSEDSVNAVKTSRKDNQQSTEQKLDSYNYAFDYIRKASKKISTTMLDPPSDKSVATSRSIRADDAGSILLRKGIIQPKHNELARVILKRRIKDSRKVGPEP